MELDLAYRWLFGMIPTEDMIQNMHEQGVTDLPSIEHGPFKGVSRPILEFPEGKEHIGYACANHLEDIYGDHTQYMRCADAQDRLYRTLIDYIKSLIYRNNMIVVVIDLANMLAGNLQNYKEALDLLPVQYQKKPVLYIVVKPVNGPERPEFYGNKVILPVLCLIPHSDPDGLKKCGKGVGETDDILLIKIYEYLARDYPEQVYAMTADKYGWMGQNNLPHVEMKFVRIIRRPIGLSPYSLAKSTVMHRTAVFAVPEHNSPFDTEPVVSVQTPADKKRETDPRYKSVICKNYTQTGQCPFGSRCVFAHGRAELPEHIRESTYKTQLCPAGSLCQNPRCQYIHPYEYL